LRRSAPYLLVLVGAACDSHLIVGLGESSAISGGGDAGAGSGGDAGAGGTANVNAGAPGAAGSQDSGGSQAAGGAAGDQAGGAGGDAGECEEPLVASGVSAGWQHACAITSDGVYCWGAGQAGQLGNSFTEDSATPVRVTSTRMFSHVQALDTTTCGVDTTATLWCWGSNYDGVLATGSAIGAPFPVEVLSNVMDFDGRAGNIVAITSGGQLYSWGSNSYGQLGLGPDSVGMTVDMVTEVSGVTAQGTAAGGHHNCVLIDGQAYCAGANDYTQLGQTGGALDTFEAVAGSVVFKGIEAAHEFTCGVTENSKVYCWGRNDPQILPEWPGAVAEPVQLGTQDEWAGLTLGFRHLCMMRDGRLFCLGGNEHGELGRSGGALSEPTEIEAGGLYSLVSAGRYFTCAIRAEDSVVVCFGNNEIGQLGRTGPDDYRPSVVCRKP
jgi:alpha-tubulin suppressor-like RCC1 family protein